MYRSEFLTKEVVETCLIVQPCRLSSDTLSAIASLKSNLSSLL